MISFPDCCVVDASVGIRLFLEEEYSEDVQAFFARALLQPDDCLFVPDLFFIECTNVLWKKVRRGEYPSEMAEADLADLRALRLPTTPTFDLMDRALKIACAHDMTAYDTCYVALADAKSVPLLTADAILAGKLAGSAHEVVVLGAACPERGDN